MSDERWGRLPGFSRYRVSSLGNVWNQNVDRMVRGRLRKDGRIQYGLYDDTGRRVDFYANRLVAMVFIPEYKGQYVRYKDGNRLNNSPENLVFNLDDPRY